MADIAELIVALKLRDGVSGGLGQLNGQLRGMQGGLSNVGRGIGQVGRGVDRIATRGAIAIGALGTAIITTAASFEQSEAGIRKTVAGTTDEVDDLVQSIKDMSRTVPLSFEELAAITAEGGALGIATENLADFTDIVARLAVSTDLSADQASSALGQLANVLHLEDEQLRDFGDSLVALGNDGASTESQILDMTARFGAAGKQAGLSNEAILALASTTASMGIEAEAGGGALSRIFNGITIDIATATEESEILADSLGFSMAELRTAWDQDAGAVFEDLLGYINQLDKFEAAEFLSNLGITNTRDINAITLLAEGADEYGRQLAVAEGQTNELNKESDAFFNTTEGKWKTFQNNVRLAADQLGSELLPVVNEVLGDLVDRLNDPGVQAGLKAFGEDLATGIRGFVEEIKKADFGPLLDTMKGAADIARGAFDAFRSLPAPIQQLALAAIVANKVTGGAVGGIAAGLGNILKGVIQIGFERGSSPANPLYVSAIGGGVGGGPGGPGGGGFAGLLKWFGIAAVAVPAGVQQAQTSVGAVEGLVGADIAGIIENGTQDQIRALRDELQGQLDSPIGELNAFLDNLGLGAGGSTVLIESIDSLTAALQQGTPDGPPEWMRPGGSLAEGNTRLDTSEGGKRTRDFLGHKLDVLPDTAMFLGQTGKIQTALTPLPPILSSLKPLSPILSEQRNSNAKASAILALGHTSAAYNARTALASEITSRKQNKITVNTTVTANVSVSATQVAQSITSTQRSINAGGAFAI